MQEEIAVNQNTGVYGCGLAIISSHWVLFMSSWALFQGRNEGGLRCGVGAASLASLLSSR
jgi:hypothetical protein